MIAGKLLGRREKRCQELILAYRFLTRMALSVVPLRVTASWVRWGAVGVRGRWASPPGPARNNVGGGWRALAAAARHPSCHAEPQSRGQRYCSSFAPPRSEKRGIAYIQL